MGQFDLFDDMHALGSRFSDAVARIMGHTSAQVLVLVGCAAWLLSGQSFDQLADGFAVGAFILAQVILNQQRRRELALQLKLNELVAAEDGARDELVGSERLSERDLTELEAQRSADAVAKESPAG